MPTPFTLWTLPERHAIEAIEDALQVFLLDADAVVGEGNDKLFSHVFGRNDEFYRHFRTPVFEGIVQKVVHQVGEVHSIRIDDLGLPHRYVSRSCRWGSSCFTF